MTYDPAVDAREFEPVVTAIESLAPGVEIIRPGRCALAAKGPSRYYGDRFGEILRTHLAEAGFTAIIGIADGPFAAEQAARLAEQRGLSELAFPPGESANCLAPLPIDAIDRPELVDLLRRLGIRTLGAFAALPARQVLARFGTDGLTAHRLASGRDSRPLASRRPPPELAKEIAFEPPVERVDQVAFAIKDTAEQMVAGLAERELVCTCLRVEVETERDAPRSRQWRHPRWFSAADVVDRVRWQLQGSNAPATPEGGRHLTSGVVRIRLVPDEVAPTGTYQDGLWGDQAPDERIHRTFTRIQSLIGHEAVTSVVLSGGRAPAERMTFVPWGDELTPARPTRQPWPGHLPPPAPTTVLAVPEPVQVLGASGYQVEVSERGIVSEECRVLVWGGGAGDATAGNSADHVVGRTAIGARPTQTTQRTEIVGWAGPWPVDERWWEPGPVPPGREHELAGVSSSAGDFGSRQGSAHEPGHSSRQEPGSSQRPGQGPEQSSAHRPVHAFRSRPRCARFQVACADGRAFVLRYESPNQSGFGNGSWWIEACYD